MSNLQFLFPLLFLVPPHFSFHPDPHGKIFANYTLRTAALEEGADIKDVITPRGHSFGSLQKHKDTEGPTFSFFLLLMTNTTLDSSRL